MPARGGGGGFADAFRNRLSQPKASNTQPGVSGSGFSGQSLAGNPSPSQGASLSGPSSAPQVKSTWNTNQKPVVIPDWANEIDARLKDGRLSNYNVVRLGADKNGNYKFMSMGESFMVLAPGQDIADYPEYVPVQVDAYGGVGAYRLRDGTETSQPGMWDGSSSFFGPKTPDHNGYYDESFKAAQEQQQVQRLLEILMAGDRGTGTPDQNTQAAGDYRFYRQTPEEMLMGLFGSGRQRPTDAARTGWRR